MYEIRCPKCNKKLAEIARPPLKELTYTKKCRCGNLIKGQIFINKKEGKIFAYLHCKNCKYTKIKLIGHLIFIKCRRCKKISFF